MVRSKTLRNCFRFILNFNAHVGQKIKNATEWQVSLDNPQSALLSNALLII